MGMRAVLISSALWRMSVGGNKRLFISSDGFSTLEKNALLYQWAMLLLQWGVTALCR
jgi:hypothetical protein